MRRIRRVLQLHFGAHVSARLIALEVGVGRSTVQDYVARATGANLGWPLAPDLDDATLEQRLFPKQAAAKPGRRRHPEPDWATLVREMKRPGVSLMILWEEYQAIHPQGYGYSRFCELYRAFERRLSPTMRQTHTPGHKAFVDYSGKKVPIVDPLTGEIRMAEIFIGVLGASNLTYAEASWTQTLPDWIGAHIRMFRFFGAVPRLLVPDNLKSGVNKASFYDPEVNRTYAAMAAHYSVGVLPARPRKPRDKAKVERAVLIVERWLLGKLRRRRFHSLAEVNAAIAELLIWLNDLRVLRYIQRSRRQLFDVIDAPLLTPLPAEPYTFAEWRVRKVGMDYHVDLDGHFYSVPYRYARATVELRATLRTVEIFFEGDRIAAHRRASGNGKHTTIADHMPSSHRRHKSWTIEKIMQEAATIGPSAELLCRLIFEGRPHPEQGVRSCRGIVNLARGFGAPRVEAACLRALEIGARAYGPVRSILDKKLDGLAAQHLRGATPQAEPEIEHVNIRGSGYYH